MSSKYILKNALVFDGSSEELIEGAAIVIEGGVIKELTQGTPRLKGAHIIDMGNRFVMPGLIDLHFHAYGISADMHQLDHMPSSLRTAHAIKLLEGTLARGFTTVRDPGGGDVGLAMAIEAGVVSGPRFLYGGKAMSQTGGHGDMRPGNEEVLCACAYSGTICEVVDGVDNVRKFCRDELRKGADHIKVFISGGVVSPNDPVWMPQYTDDEIRAAVEETATKRKYVIAHCHTDDGARRCLSTGVRSIDHCSMITEETAGIIASADGSTFAVPTIAIIRQFVDQGDRMGLSEDGCDKARFVYDKTMSSLEYLDRAGARLGLGTDLLGPRFHALQNMEFKYRCEVQKPIDVLRSATSIGAEIVKRSGEIGSIAPGAHADIIALDRNPIEYIDVITTPEISMPFVMKGGEVVRSLFSA